MNVLALDTALAACTVVVDRGEGAGRLAARSTPMLRGHAEALMPMLAEAMAEAGLAYADLARIAVTVGPGTFTGVRVGVAAARGLGLATGRPVVGLNTLAALAETARRQGGTPAGLVAAIDARRGAIYAQSFAADGRPLDAPRVAACAEVAATLPVEAVAAVGSAAAMLAEAAAAQGRRLAVAGEDAAPAAAALARLAQDASLSPAPLYLRPADAKRQDGAAIARR